MILYDEIMKSVKIYVEAINIIKLINEKDKKFWQKNLKKLDEIISHTSLNISLRVLNFINTKLYIGL